MNKIIYLVTFILIIYNISTYSQNIIDPPHLVRLDTTDALNRNYQGFMLGWNWSSPGSRLDSVMNINTYHGFEHSTFEGLNKCAENLLVIEPPGRYYSYITGARGVNCVFNAHCLYLEPALTVDTTQNFTPSNWNRSGAVFGFQYKNSTGIIDTNENGNLIYKNIWN